MPEINPFRKSNFLKEFSKEKDKVKQVPDPDDFEKIAKNFGIKKLGSGNECFVVDDPESKEKVIAISYKNLSPEGAKDIYYSSKILSTLFPHNFPKIHSASAKNESDEFNGTVREKIHGKTLYEQNINYSRMTNPDFKEEEGLSLIIKNIRNYILNKKTTTQYPFVKTYKEMMLLREHPYNLRFLIDTSGKNFIKDDNGNEYFVDTIKIGQEIKETNTKVNIEAVEEYMRERKYSDSDILRVSSALGRLDVLFGE